MQKSVDSFSGKYESFSNFYPAIVFYEGIRFPTVEHAFVAAKSIDRNFRLMISKIPQKQAGKAKRKGRKIELRPNWEDIKVEIMRNLLRQKFKQPRFKNLLLETDNAVLTEGNYWHDNFWGDCNCEKCQDIIGINALGLLLMRIRHEIRNKDTKIYEPWTEEEVENLKQRQQRKDLHPYTCGRCTSLLVPTTEGWICPTTNCDYRQHWAHKIDVK